MHIRIEDNQTVRKDEPNSGCWLLGTQTTAVCHLEPRQVKHGSNHDMDLTRAQGTEINIDILY